MPTYETVCIAIMIVSFVVLLIYLLKIKEPNESYLSIIISVLILSIVGIAIGETQQYKYIPKEFPSKEYKLRYKAVEVDGQRDTIYVLTKIKEDDI